MVKKAIFAPREGRDEQQGKERNIYSGNRKVKKWIVTYFGDDGEVVGPIWNVESKIKPTQWAKRAFKDWPVTYKIKEVADFNYEGYKDSFVKSDEPDPALSSVKREEVTVTFYPLDVERYGRKFVRQFPDVATWERVRANLTGTYHSIDVEVAPGLDELAEEAMHAFCQAIVGSEVAE